MNDEFLNQFLEAPRAEFADTLYERISRQPQPRFPQTMMKNLTFRNAAVAFVLLFLVAACVYAVSEKRWNKVGGIWVDVQKTLKLHWDPHEPRVMEFPDSECLTLEEVRETLRFEFQVPTWAPEGFTFANSMCGLDRTSDYAGFQWKGADEDSGISISLQNLRWYDAATQKYKIRSPSTMLPVGPDSYEEVQIHGQPAVLVRGDWEWPWGTEDSVEVFAGMEDAELNWDKKRGLQLYWVQGDVLYSLSTHANVSAEDLIRMAESTR